MFIGDSVNDLPALLSADLPLVIGSSSSLNAAMQRFGVACKPLLALLLPFTADGKEVVRREGRDGLRDVLSEGGGDVKVVYRVRSWSEVEVLLFGGMLE